MRVIAVPLRYVHAYALIEAGRALLIDSGPPGNEELILASLKAEGIGAGDVKLIVLTHAHADHSGGAKRIRILTGALVGVHKQSVRFLQSGVCAPVKAATLTGRLLAPIVARANAKLTVQCDPDLIFEDSVSLQAQGFSARVIPTPGHTAGCISVISDAGDAFIGDLVVRRFVTFGPASLPIFAIAKEQVITSLKAVLAERPRRCYSSHAGVVTVEDLENLVQRWSRH